MNILHGFYHFLNSQYEKIIGAGLPAWVIANARITVQEEFALKTIWYLLVAPISVILCTLAKKYVEMKWEAYKQRKNKNNGSIN